MYLKGRSTIFQVTIHLKSHMQNSRRNPFKLFIKNYEEDNIIVTCGSIVAKKGRKLTKLISFKILNNAYSPFKWFRCYDMTVGASFQLYDLNTRLVGFRISLSKDVLSGNSKTMPKLIFLIYFLVAQTFGDDVMINILPGPTILTVQCEPEGGDWKCFEQSEPEHCGVGYSCQESVYQSNFENINLFCEYQDEYEQWNCPTLDLRELLETRCRPVTGVCPAGAEALTVSSGASGSVLLSSEFSSSCPAEKICYNRRYKKCCSLIKLGRRYKCPKSC